MFSKQLLICPYIMCVKLLFNLFASMPSQYNLFSGGGLSLACSWQSFFLRQAADSQVRLPVIHKSESVLASSVTWSTAIFVPCNLWNMATQALPGVFFLLCILGEEWGNTGFNLVLVMVENNDHFSAWRRSSMRSSGLFLLLIMAPTSW